MIHYCYYSASFPPIANRSSCLTRIVPFACFIELQGHAIKNQDLLVASGTISLKGSEGLSAVDEDVEAATAVRLSVIHSFHHRILVGILPIRHISTHTPPPCFYYYYYYQSRSIVMEQEFVTPDYDIRQRDRELREIAKSIGSLAELFKDLSVLVIDQGTLLDSVEYNIQQTAVQMEDAVKVLGEATKSVLSTSCCDVLVVKEY